VIVAVVAELTAEVVIVKVAVVWPAATLTLAGVVALLEFEPRVMVVPLGPAGPFRVTVPVDELPLVTADGETATLCRVAGLIVRAAVCLSLPRNELSVAVTVESTPPVVIRKVAVVAPSFTVTDAGTVALALSECKPIEVVGPAGPLKVTVPIDLLLPTSEVGEMDIAFNVAGLIVSVCCFEIVPSVAEIVEVATADTPNEVIVNVVVVAPPGITTVVGTTALALVEPNVIGSPLAGPEVAIVTVPVDV